MSTEKNVSGLLARLNKSLNKKQEGNKGTTRDFKKEAEERKKCFVKCAEGRNDFVFLVPEGREDPFFEWGYHQGLQEVAWHSVACDAANKGEDCVICNVVEELQKDNFKGNMHIWQPIQKRIEIYAPVVDLNNLAAGARWIKVPKNVITTMVGWLEALEPNEVPFYDHDEPKKIIMTYKSSEAPATKYQVVEKPTERFSEEQIADWLGNLKSLDSLMISRKAEDVKKILDEYFARIENMVKEENDKKSPSDDEDQESFPNNLDDAKDVELQQKASSKLSSLKKK